MLTVERPEAATDGSASDLQDFRETVSSGEGELLRELVRAMRTIRCGSITLTLHMVGSLRSRKQSEFGEMETKKTPLTLVMNRKFDCLCERKSGNGL
jgi:hypothetical protein